MPEPNDAVEAVRRWQESGAVWRVLARPPSRVTVCLCRCDDGEEVERFTSGDPELLAFLGDRSSSDSSSDEE